MERIIVGIWNLRFRLGRAILPGTRKHIILDD